MNREDLWRLVQEHNSTLGQIALPDDVLRASFEAIWPDLQVTLADIWHVDASRHIKYFKESESEPRPKHKPGRRISNFEELVELWPALLMRIRKRIGVAAVAYLHDARPLLLEDEHIVFEFSKLFHFQAAVKAMERLPFESTICEVLDKPRTLKFVLQNDNKPENEKGV